MNLEECYKSLALAKEEIFNLEQENERFFSLRTDFQKLKALNDIPISENDIPISEIVNNLSLSSMVNELQDVYRQKFKSNIFLFILFLLIYGIVSLIFYQFFTDFNPVSIISSCTTVFIISNSEDLKMSHKYKKMLKILDKIRKKLVDDKRFDSLNISECITLMENITRENYQKMEEHQVAIKEYEQYLGEINNQLANEILKNEGIEATITLDATVKKLDLKKVKVQ